MTDSLYNLEVNEPEQQRKNDLMDTCHFEQKQQYDNAQQQQQKPEHKRQSLMDNQSQGPKLKPHVFDTYNMPRVNCFTHRGQTITNFCKSQDCLLPLCPECVKDHVQEHSEFKTYPKLDCLENILTEVHADAFAQASDLIKAFQNIEKSVSLAEQHKILATTKLQEVKQRIYNIVDQYFNALENELCQKQNRNLENFKRDSESLKSAIDQRWLSYINFMDRLKQSECMYSLLPYLISPPHKDNEEYIKTSFEFSNKFKEASSIINFDSYKSSQLSSMIDQIISVTHHDLPEFIEMHKLAPPEIIKSKVLAVKVEDNIPAKVEAQKSNRKKSVRIKETENPRMEQSLEQTLKYPQPTYQQQQIQQPIQVQQNQYYSQPQSLVQSTYPTQYYPQQSYNYGQPVQTPKYNQQPTQQQFVQQYPQQQQYNTQQQPYNSQLFNSVYQTSRYY